MQEANCAAPGNGELLFEALEEVQPFGKSARTNRDFFALESWEALVDLAALAVPSKKNIARTARRPAMADFAARTRRGRRARIRNLPVPRP
jgi:hypothetical protein